jgi:hypothetical protein
MLRAPGSLCTVSGFSAYRKSSNIQRHVYANTRKGVVPKAGFEPAGNITSTVVADSQRLSNLIQWQSTPFAIQCIVTRLRTLADGNRM